MSQFEYITIATTLVLSFSFARTLSNVAPVLESNERYWVHTLWVVLLLVNHLTVFFGTAMQADVEIWTFAKFCAILVPPLIVLQSATVLLPNRPVTNFRKHIESIRVPFYVLWGLLGVLVQPQYFLMHGTIDYNQLVFTCALGSLFFWALIFGDRASIKSWCSSLPPWLGPTSC